MNDLTPTKLAHQSSDDAVPLAQAHVATNAEQASNGSPGRWPKRLGIAAVALVLVTVAAGGTWYWQKASKTYKIGKHAFTDKDAQKTAARLAKSKPSADKPTDKKQLLQEANTSLTMLVALKAEADKHNIKYDNATIDAEMNQLYVAKGSKQAYFDYMKKQYSYDEQTTYDTLVTQYLKENLEPLIISKKQFVIIYVRWDGIKLFDPDNYDTVYKRREAEMTNKYLPLIKQGASIEALRGAVELSDTADEETTKKVYAATSNAPVGIQLLTTGNVKFESYQDGVDVMKQLDSLKKTGDVVGPFKGADGRLAIARLERIMSQGGYHSWDDFLDKAKQTAGLSKAGEAQKSFSMASKRVVTAIGSVLGPQQAKAAAVELNCASPGNHRVTYNVTLVNSENGQRLWQTYTMGAGAQRLIRYNATLDDNWCSSANYTSNNFIVGSQHADGFASVAKYFTSDQFGYLSLVLDCWGPPWSIGPAQPVISGFTFVGSSGDFTFNSGSNGQTYNLTFRYKPIPPVQENPTPSTPYCTLSISGSGVPSASNMYSASWANYNVNSTNLSAKLKNTQNGNEATLGYSQSGSAGIVPAANTTSGYRYTVYSNGTAISSCTATVTPSSNPQNPPPENPPPPQPNAYNTCLTKAMVAPSATPSVSGLGTENYVTINIEKGQTVDMYAGLAYKWIANDEVVPNSQVIAPTWTLTPFGRMSPIETKRDNTSAIIKFSYAPTSSVTFALEPLELGQIAQSCFVRINVGAAPGDPTNGPWLQSKWGNTTAIREITSNKAGDRGSRPVAATEKEAQYVVMAYIVNNFCSTKGYNFGAGSGGGCTYPVGYRVNPSIYRSGDLGGPDDPIIANLRKILANSATNDTSCNAQKPYFVVPNLTAVLGSPAVSFGATASCAKVGTLTSATLSSHTFSQGRATIFVDGNLTITADNVVNYGGSYLSPNEVPNVGLIVKGDITIDPAVKNLDISMYATGKIKTCTTYPNPNCNTQLKVRGIMAAAGGFELGRNLYGASPSELIVGSGLIEAFPPPGFIDVSSNKVVGVKYLSTESNPRF